MSMAVNEETIDPEPSSTAGDPENSYTPIRAEDTAASSPETTPGVQLAAGDEPLETKLKRIYCEDEARKAWANKVQEVPKDYFGSPGKLNPLPPSGPVGAMKRLWDWLNIFKKLDDADAYKQRYVDECMKKPIPTTG